MSERKPGWYWVKTGVGWECAKWERGNWYIACAAFAYDDKDWQEIGPCIPTPDEPQPSTPVGTRGY